MDYPLVLAGVGSREITKEEEVLVEKTGAWCARNGILVRSGGAIGADQAWARGAASVDPRLVYVNLPADDARSLSRAPRGSVIEVPPYPEWLVEMAIAEYTFKHKLLDVGFPPYSDPKVQERYEKRSSWNWLAQKQSTQETEKIRKKNPDAPEVVIEPNTAYVQQLMIRNAAILHTREGRQVDICIGLLNPDRDGGGTGHTFRIAKALGIPTFDLRNAEEAKLASATLKKLVASRVNSSRRI